MEVKIQLKYCGASPVVSPSLMKKRRTSNSLFIHVGKASLHYFLQLEQLLSLIFTVELYKETQFLLPE